MEKVIVQFFKGYLNYVPGDITQLDKDTAQELAKKNILAITSPSEAEENALPKEIKVITANHPKKELICPICGKEFKTQRGVKTHKKKVHAIE